MADFTWTSPTRENNKTYVKNPIIREKDSATPTKIVSYLDLVKIENFQYFGYLNLNLNDSSNIRIKDFIKAINDHINDLNNRLTAQGR